MIGEQFLLNCCLWLVWLAAVHGLFVDTFACVSVTRRKLQTPGNAEEHKRQDHLQSTQFACVVFCVIRGDAMPLPLSPCNQTRTDAPHMCLPHGQHTICLLMQVADFLADRDTVNTATSHLGTLLAGSMGNSSHEHMQDGVYEDPLQNLVLPQCMHAYAMHVQRLLVEPLLRTPCGGLACAEAQAQPRLCCPLCHSHGICDLAPRLVSWNVGVTHALGSCMGRDMGACLTSLS